jgi:hypothetical protein
LNKRTSINSIPTIHKEKEMADFRKWLYAFAVVALLAGLTVPASAQTFQTCIGGAVNPVIRAEGYTELAGDLTITCSGGTPTAPGGTVPAVTINVSMNTAITSKITSTAFTPAFNEALLLIDEPGTVIRTGTPPVVTIANDLLSCGSPGAPFNTATSGAGECSIVNNGAPNASGFVGIYNGAHGAVVAGVPTPGHPNVFQGRQVSGSGNQIIQFIGVPLDGGSHILRITNLRGNAVQLSGGHITNPNFGLGLSFQTIVTFTSPNSVNAQLIQVVNGSIRNGLDSVSGTNAGPFLQCTFNRARSVDGGSITLLEGFASAWKVRNWRQIQDNGAFVGTPDWQYNGTSVYSLVDVTQNVPGSQYNTESGFMYPPPPVLPPGINPPQGISNSFGTPPGNQAFTDTPDTGISSAGSVSNGTRFAIKFASIPAGTTISVPAAINLINVSGGNGNITGRMLAVGGTDANGAGGNVGVGGTITSGVNFTVIYEVIFDDPLAIESATIPVTANVVAFDGTLPQVNVIATGQASFAPFYDNGAGSIAGCPLQLDTPLRGACGTGFGPIPRFVSGLLPAPKPVDLFSFSRCACDMLFPWVVGDATFTTSIVVANTSLDPGPAFGFTAAPQSGKVTFWFYGTSDISFNPTSFGTASDPGTVVASQQTTVSIPAGSYVAFVISPSNPGATTQTAGNGLGPILDGATGKVATNFAGYVITQSDFQYCHGIASISAPGISPQTYLGLVLDKATVLFGNFTPTGGGSGTIILGSPQELQRTNQVFADELDH